MKFWGKGKLGAGAELGIRTAVGAGKSMVLQLLLRPRDLGRA